MKFGSMNVSLTNLNCWDWEILFFSITRNHYLEAGVWTFF